METQEPVSASKPVRVLGTILAVLAALSGYVATIDAVPDWVKLVIAGLVVLLTVGLSKWTENQTVPFKNVAARVIDQTGRVIAGPAAEPTAGVVSGESVQVTSLPAV